MGVTDVCCKTFCRLDNLHPSFRFSEMCSFMVMAMQKLILVAQCHLGLFHSLGSVQCHRAPAWWGRYLSRTAAAVQARTVEKLWQEFFSDPSQWWDHRLEKVNTRYPDFKHKTTQEALWLNGKLNPQWVEAELAAMAPGSVQSNSFSWNRRLARYVKVGQYEQTMELYKQMEQDGIIPDKFTFVPVLNACASLQALEQGRRVHTQIIQSGCESDVYVGSSLVDMYAKCGNIKDAWTVFNKMPTRDVVAWNAMILGCVKCQQGQLALQLSQLMQQDGLEPVPVTFVGLLNACASIAALEEGRCIHAQIIQKGYEYDVFVGSGLIDMYAKCGSIEDAWRVFNKMPVLDVVAWNAMIQGFVKCGQGQKGLELSLQMQQEGVEPDPCTFVASLNACASVKALEEGRRIHEQIIQRGYESDVFVGSGLVYMYSKCGSREDAWTVFNKMTTHNVISYNAMILGNVKCGQGHKALELSQQMQRAGIEPDPVTFVGMLNACGSVAALKEGKNVHEQIIQRGFGSDVVVCNSLIDMYGKCGDIDNAWRVFNEMHTRDVVSWNAIIRGHVKCGHGREALKLYEHMQQEALEPDSFTFVGVLNACASEVALEEGRRVHQQIIQRGWESDVFVGACLVDMYAKCGSIEDALRVFNRMSTRDMVAWSAMIQGYVRCGLVQKALELSQEMEREGLDPDPVTFMGLLSACSSVAALEKGRHFHKQIIQKGFESDVFVGSSLIDMYAKCGSIKDAWRVFDKMPSRNMVSWNTMLSGYAMHGQAKEALRHFEKMSQEGVEITWISFISLLSVCSHAGLVDEGVLFFESMSSVYRINATVEHYTCMVDLLSRAGRLHEAEDLIKKMCSDPNATVWMPLLGSCRVHGNVEMGKCIAKKVVEMDPGNAAGYVLLSNIYAAAGNWDNSSSLQQQRLQRGVMKQPGCSWIILNNEVHSFAVDDQEHPRVTEIHAELKRLAGQLKDAGHVPDTRFVLHDVNEEEKVSRLWHHSERLAIALGLISTPPHTPLYIFKNLRVW